MPILSPDITFVTKANVAADTAVLLVFGDKKLTPLGKDLDKRLDGLLQHHLDTHPKFKGDAGQTLSIALPAGADYLRVILLGLGTKTKLSADTLETIGGKLVAALGAHGSVTTTLLNSDDVKGGKLDVLSSLLLGVRLGSYRFDDYKTVKKDAGTLKSLSVVTGSAKTHAKTSETVEALAQSIALTRDLVNAPPNKLYPESFADIIKTTLSPLGVKVQVMDDKALQKMGMGCLLAVGQASEHLPRLVVMSWAGTGTAKQKSEKPIAFVGKGITFDSGGLNVKPYEGMMDMKVDMGGAATVVGLMSMLAKRECKVPVVAIVALAENAISDEATRPSDIVTSYSGKTVEILNTDAEGRLVLADALTYIQKTYDPKLVIDLATLTGAIRIALGLNYCGAFSNNDSLWKQLEKSSSQTGEKLWRMPLDENFRREMDSAFADIKNISSSGFAGSCTAAAFLNEFIDENRPWTHLDIVGVSMCKTPTPTCPVPFASGFGVKLLNAFVEEFHG